MLPDGRAWSRCTATARCLNAPTGAWCSLTFIILILVAVFGVSMHLQVRGAPRPDDDEVAEGRHPYVSMHLQVRGAPRPVHGGVTGRVPGRVSMHLQVRGAPWLVLVAVVIGAERGSQCTYRCVVLPDCSKAASPRRRFRSQCTYRCVVLPDISNGVQLSEREMSQCTYRCGCSLT